MNKMKKTLALTTTALLAMGSAFTSFAANGWVRDNGVWSYYDSNGDRVTETWRKSGADDYYLNSEGVLGQSMLIDDGDNYYATNSAGRMVKNAWRQFDDDGELEWYYFQGTGKAKKDGFLTINGAKYHFTDAKMDTGWLNDDGDIYLLSEDDADLGKVVTGWKYVDDFDDDADVSAEEEGWYYFGTNGKMVSGQEKKINGKYYVFNDDGLMLDNWVEFTRGETASNSNATPSNADSIYKYYREGTGYRMSGWRYLEDMDADDEGKDTEEGWYYFKDGIPYTATHKTTEIADGYGVAKINSKIYCFDENGKMVTGKVTANDGKFFYFDEDESDGAMKYGKVNIKNADDLDDGTYYFVDKGDLGEKGASKTGVVKGYLYDNGELVKAEDGMRYEKVTVDGKDYMVNESGKIKTSGKVTDGDDVKWEIKKDENGNYVITRVD